MEEFLPSEISRLVLGYLEDEDCSEAYEKFIKTSENLKECLRFWELGKKFDTKVHGSTLRDILNEYLTIKYLVEEAEKQTEDNEVSTAKSSNLVERIKALLKSVGKTVFLSITLPPNDSNKLKNRNLAKEKRLKRKTATQSKSESDHTDNSNHFNASHKTLEATPSDLLPGNSPKARPISSDIVNSETIVDNCVTSPEKITSMERNKSEKNFNVNSMSDFSVSGLFTKYIENGTTGSGDSLNSDLLKLVNEIEVSANKNLQKSITSDSTTTAASKITVINNLNSQTTKTNQCVLEVDNEEMFSQRLDNQKSMMFDEPSTVSIQSVVKLTKTTETIERSCCAAENTPSKTKNDTFGFSLDDSLNKLLSDKSKPNDTEIMTKNLEKNGRNVFPLDDSFNKLLKVNEKPKTVDEITTKNCETNFDGVGLSTSGNTFVFPLDDSLNKFLKFNNDKPPNQQIKPNTTSIATSLVTTTFLPNQVIGQQQQPASTLNNKVEPSSIYIVPENLETNVQNAEIPSTSTSYIVTTPNQNIYLPTMSPICGQILGHQQTNLGNIYLPVINQPSIVFQDSLLTHSNQLINTINNQPLINQSILNQSNTIKPSSIQVQQTTQQIQTIQQQIQPIQQQIQPIQQQTQSIQQQIQSINQQTQQMQPINQQIQTTQQFQPITQQIQTQQMQTTQQFQPITQQIQTQQMQTAQQLQPITQQIQVMIGQKLPKKRGRPTNRQNNSDGGKIIRRIVPKRVNDVLSKIDKNYDSQVLNNYQNNETQNQQETLVVENNQISKVSISDQNNKVTNEKGIMSSRISDFKISNQDNKFMFTISMSTPFDQIGQIKSSVGEQCPNNRIVEINNSVFESNETNLMNNETNSKIDESNLKPNEPNLKTNEPNLKTNEPNLNINESSLKINEPNLKINEPDLNINESSLKINEPNLKINESDLNINESSLKINEPNLNNDFSSKTNEFNLKVIEPDLSINEPNLKINESILNINETNLNINEQNLKVNEPDLKTNDPSLKMNDSNLRINEPNLKINEMILKVIEPNLNINDLNLKINKPKTNDQNLNINEQNLKINESSLKMNELNLKRNFEINEPNLIINEPNLKIDEPNKKYLSIESSVTKSTSILKDPTELESAEPIVINKDQLATSTPSVDARNKNSENDSDQKGTLQTPTAMLLRPATSKNTLSSSKSSRSSASHVRVLDFSTPAKTTNEQHDDKRPEKRELFCKNSKSCNKTGLTNEMDLKMEELFGYITPEKEIERFDVVRTSSRRNFVQLSKSVENLTTIVPFTRRSRSEPKNLNCESLINLENLNSLKKFSMKISNIFVNVDQIKLSPESFDNFQNIDSTIDIIPPEKLLNLCTPKNSLSLSSSTSKKQLIESLSESTDSDNEKNKYQVQNNSDSSLKTWDQNLRATIGDTETNSNESSYKRTPKKDRRRRYMLRSGRKKQSNETTERGKIMSAKKTKVKKSMSPINETIPEVRTDNIETTKIRNLNANPIYKRKCNPTNLIQLGENNEVLIENSAPIKLDSYAINYDNSGDENVATAAHANVELSIITDSNIDAIPIIIADEVVEPEESLQNEDVIIKHLTTSMLKTPSKDVLFANLPFSPKLVENNASFVGSLPPLDTPFSKFINENSDYFLSNSRSKTKITTPFPITPRFILTPSLTLTKTQNKVEISTPKVDYNTRGTDYSGGSSYYQPSDENEPSILIENKTNDFLEKKQLELINTSSNVMTDCRGSTKKKKPRGSGKKIYPTNVKKQIATKNLDQLALCVLGKDISMIMKESEIVEEDCDQKTKVYPIKPINHIATKNLSKYTSYMKQRPRRLSDSSTSSSELSSSEESKSSSLSKTSSWSTSEKDSFSSDCQKRDGKYNLRNRLTIKKNKWLSDDDDGCSKTLESKTKINKANISKSEQILLKSAKKVELKFSSKFDKRKTRKFENSTSGEDQKTSENNSKRKLKKIKPSGKVNKPKLLIDFKKKTTASKVNKSATISTKTSSQQIITNRFGSSPLKSDRVHLDNLETDSIDSTSMALVTHLKERGIHLVPNKKKSRDVRGNNDRCVLVSKTFENNLTKENLVVGNVFERNDDSCLQKNSSSSYLEYSVVENSSVELNSKNISEEKVDENKIDISVNKIDSLENKIDASKNKIDKSKNQIDMTYENIIDSSKNKIDSSKNKIDSYKNIIDSPKNKIDISVNKNDLSENKIDTTENKNDRSKNKIDIQENKINNIEILNDTNCVDSNITSVIEVKFNEKTFKRINSSELKNLINQCNNLKQFEFSFEIEEDDNNDEICNTVVEHKLNVTEFFQLIDIQKKSRSQKDKEINKRDEKKQNKYSSDNKDINKVSSKDKDSNKEKVSNRDKDSSKDKNEIRKNKESNRNKDSSKNKDSALSKDKTLRNFLTEKNQESLKKTKEFSSKRVKNKTKEINKSESRNFGNDNNKIEIGKVSSSVKTIKNINKQNPILDPAELVHVQLDEKSNDPFLNFEPENEVTIIKLPKRKTKMVLEDNHKSNLAIDDDSIQISPVGRKIEKHDDVYRDDNKKIIISLEDGKRRINKTDGFYENKKEKSFEVVVAKMKKNSPSKVKRKIEGLNENEKNLETKNIKIETISPIELKRKNEKVDVIEKTNFLGRKNKMKDKIEIRSHIKNDANLIKNNVIENVDHVPNSKESKILLLKPIGNEEKTNDYVKYEKKIIEKLETDQKSNQKIDNLQKQKRLEVYKILLKASSKDKKNEKITVDDDQNYNETSKIVVSINKKTSKDKNVQKKKTFEDDDALVDDKLEIGVKKIDKCKNDTSVKTRLTTKKEQLIISQREKANIVQDCSVVIEPNLKNIEIQNCSKDHNSIEDHLENKLSNKEATEQNEDLISDLATKRKRLETNEIDSKRVRLDNPNELIKTIDVDGFLSKLYGDNDNSD